jgi:hypothetical protein
LEPRPVGGAFFFPAVTGGIIVQEHSLMFGRPALSVGRIFPLFGMTWTSVALAFHIRAGNGEFDREKSTKARNNFQN